MHNGAVFVSRKRPLLNSGTTIRIHPDQYLLLEIAVLASYPSLLLKVNCGASPGISGTLGAVALCSCMCRNECGSKAQPT